MNALTAAWNQFLKDADKLPGWVPLFVVTLFAVDSSASSELPLSRELLAGVLTLLLYAVGDALDEVLFKTGPEGARETRGVFKRMYCAKLKAARDEMGVGRGVYSVALKLVGAGEKPLGKLAIHFPNETAKLLRAFILPLAVVSVFLFSGGRADRAVVCMAGALLLLPGYLLLKVFHLRRLYSTASGLARDNDHCNTADMGRVRLVFWDGELIGSGLSVAAGADPADAE